MTRVLQSGWVAVVVGTLLYLGTTVVLWKPLQVAPRTAQAPAHEKPPSPALAPSWEFHNPEVDQLMAELKKEREEVALRAKQLDELQQRVEAEKAEISQVREKVQVLQKEFDKNVTRVQAEEAVNLKRLAKTYASMSPESAALIFKEVDDQTLVKILLQMKDTETAPILESMAQTGNTEAKRAASLTDQLRLALPPAENKKRANSP